MIEELPNFRYHPNPVATGSIVASENEFVCCKQSRGYIYVASVYSVKDYDGSICPWCIADGTAANRLGVGFYGGVFEKLPANVWEEINDRTPGYNSWQTEDWKVHCDDACEFHGDVTGIELRSLAGTNKEWLRSEMQRDEKEWGEFVTAYKPPWDPAIYKFVCRHCGVVLLHWDCS